MTHQIAFSFFSLAFTFFDKSFVSFPATFLPVTRQENCLTTARSPDLALLPPLSLLHQSHRIWSSACCSIQANFLRIGVPAKCLKCKMGNVGLQTGWGCRVFMWRKTQFMCINVYNQPKPLLRRVQNYGSDSVKRQSRLLMYKSQDSLSSTTVDTNGINDGETLHVVIIFILASKIHISIMHGTQAAASTCSICPNNSSKQHKCTQQKKRRATHCNRTKSIYCDLKIKLDQKKYRVIFPLTDQEIKNY